MLQFASEFSRLKHRQLAVPILSLFHSRNSRLLDCESLQMFTKRASKGTRDVDEFDEGCNNSRVLQKKYQQNMGVPYAHAKATQFTAYMLKIRKAPRTCLRYIH